MPSVIHIKNPQISDGRMIGLTVSAIGTLDDITSMFMSLKTAVQERFVKPKNCLFFDSQYTELAESCPQKLHISPFRFRVPSKLDSCVNIPWQKTYWGYFCTEKEKVCIHHHLFCKQVNGIFGYEPPLYFSKRLLSDMLKKIYQADIVVTDTVPVADIIICLECKRIESGLVKGTFCCQIAGYSLEYKLAPIIEWYDRIVKELDEQYNSCFHSAYISYMEESVPISHSGFFKNSCSARENTLLGCEWSTYLCNAIFQKICETDLDCIAKIATIEHLQNGVQYTANTTIDMFSKSERELLQRAFKSVLQPGYAVIYWNVLCNQTSPLFSESFDEVALYSEKYFGGKSLIIPFQIPMAMIEETDETYKNQCTGILRLN